MSYHEALQLYFLLINDAEVYGEFEDDQYDS